MILVRNLKLTPGENEEALLPKAIKKLPVPASAVKEYRLIRRSLDARRKDDIHYVCSLALSVHGDESKMIARAKNGDVSLYQERPYSIPHCEATQRPVVVGFGPAGMFAALVLALAGAKPIVMERGQDVDARVAAVARFRRDGVLDPECNVQFGEGGAGTFSDGKLNTGTKDWRMGWMLAQLQLHGAPERILVDAKPHIGTDILVDVVKNIRKHILALGGEVRFGTRCERLILEKGHLRGIEVRRGSETETIACSQLILAIGHSARDSFEMLHALGIPMQPKAFSMGVRVEHKQREINTAQYGTTELPLPAADYSLNVHLPDGTSAYTFCMCPGGEVIAAASEHGGVVTNGMSFSRRDGENANAALLVTLHPEDFPDPGILSGMYWQREIEQAAYAYGGGNYSAPAQLVGDFLAHRPSEGPGSVLPSYRPGVIWGDLRQVLPERIWSVLENALPLLGKKLPGFDNADAVMTAPETRSSSPVRIERDALCRSAIAGLYPCGEGAGYAGGISSAAVDGMRCAEAVLRDLPLFGQV